MAQKVEICQVSADEAEAVMQAAEIADPTGRASASDIAKGGDAFRLTVGNESGVMVLKPYANIGLLWVNGAGAVATSGLCAPGLAVIETMAKKNGFERVGFQTGRPGLVRLAKKSGYRVTGFILEKVVS